MADFNYLLDSNSFKQDAFSNEIVYQNIERLSLLKEKLNDYKEKLFKDDNIYYINIIDNKPIYEVLHDDTLDSDYKVMLASIIDRSSDIVNGMKIDSHIGLNHCIGHTCIYSIEDWILFHHTLLSTKFSNEEDFYNGIVKYFPNLKFHSNIENTLNTLDGGCEYFIADIIKSLQCLNNELHYDIESTNNLPEALKMLTSKLGLKVTLEGNASRKKDLSFIFMKYNKEEINIYCEPHVKLEKSSNSSDSKWYSNRIYFHQGYKDIEDGKILVGYIGEHL